MIAGVGCVERPGHLGFLPRSGGHIRAGQLNKVDPDKCRHVHSWVSNHADWLGQIEELGCVWRIARLHTGEFWWPREHALYYKAAQRDGIGPS
jgi:hypothetical protein